MTKLEMVQQAMAVRGEATPEEIAAFEQGRRLLPDDSSEGELIQRRRLDGLGIAGRPPLRRRSPLPNEFGRTGWGHPGEASVHHASDQMLHQVIEDDRQQHPGSVGQGH